MTLKTVMAADLAVLFSDFAADAAITGGSTIKVVFDKEGTVLNFETSEVETTKPQALAKTSDVTSVAHGTVLTIEDTAYKVIKKTPLDGDGLTTLLILSED